MLRAPACLPAAVLLCLVSVPALAQGTSDSLRDQLRSFLSPLGTPQGASAIGALVSLEVSTAPLGTSTGGFTFNFDPQRRTWNRTASTFGPAFAERGLTTGRGKFSIGVNYLHAGYDSFNDQELDNNEFRPAQNAVGVALSYSAATLDLESDTVVAFGHAGVTDRLDVGVAIPWIRVGLSGEGGFFTAADQQLVAFTLPATSDAGIGDMAIFGKYLLARHQQGGLAVAAELRLPTGDRDEFRGLDVTRTLISGVWSYGGRVSPHVNIGYEFWSDQVDISQAGDVYAKDQFKYAFGVEFEAHPLATVVVDLVGRNLRNGGSVDYQRFTTPEGAAIDALVGVPEGLNQVSLAPGVKWNAWGSALITGNVLFTLSNQGLRADTIPVIGLDWSF